MIHSNPTESSLTSKMPLKHPRKTESELISKRVENSKREIEKLKVEYERLVRQGLANSRSSETSPSEVCTAASGNDLTSVNNSETGTRNKSKPVSEVINGDSRIITNALGSESDPKSKGELVKSSHSKSNSDYATNKSSSASDKKSQPDINKVSRVEFDNHYSDDFNSKSPSVGKILQSGETVKPIDLSDNSMRTYTGDKSQSAIDNNKSGDLKISPSGDEALGYRARNTDPRNVISERNVENGVTLNVINFDNKDEKNAKPRISLGRSGVKKCNGSPRKDFEENVVVCCLKNKKNYDVEGTRVFMRKQKEKRLEQMRMKLKESVNTVEGRKRKLKELNERSLKIITKNRERSRSRSKETPLVTDKILRPLHDANKAIDQKRASRERVTVRSRHQEQPPPPLTYRVPDDNLREKAATVLQSYFRGYKQRKVYKQSLDAKKEQEQILLSKERASKAKRMKDEKDFPDWLQAKQSYPYNFISAVKQKLNITINTPKKTSDVAIQSTPQSSKELEAKIENGIKKHSSQSDPLLAESLIKKNNLSSRDLKEKVARSITGSEKTNSSSLDPNLSLKNLKRNIEKSISSRSEKTSSSSLDPNLNLKTLKRNVSGRSEKNDLMKRIHSICEYGTSLGKDLNLRAVESLKLISRNNDKSGSDTSKNVPDLSSENSSKLNIKSVSRDYSSAFESLHVAKPSKDKSISSGGISKSIYSQYSSSPEPEEARDSNTSKLNITSVSKDYSSALESRHGVAKPSKDKSDGILKSVYSQYSTSPEVEEAVDSNTSIESYRTYSKKKLTSSNYGQDDVFKKPQGVAKKSDLSSSKKSNKENSIPVISINSIADAASDSDGDFKLEINAERLKKLRLLRRKERHDGFDNTIEVIGDFGNRKRSVDVSNYPSEENSHIKQSINKRDFGNRKRTNSIDFSSDIYGIPSEENGHIKHSINKPSEEKTSESSIMEVNKEENKQETKFESVTRNRSRSQEVMDTHLHSDPISKTHSSKELSNRSFSRRQSIIISSNRSNFSPDYSNHSSKSRNTVESESVKEDLASFREYMRDFKFNRRPKRKSSAGDLKTSAKDSVPSFRTMKSTSTESANDNESNRSKSTSADGANDEGNGSKGSESTTIDEKLSSEVVRAVPLVAPVVSLQSNYCSDKDNVVKEVKEFTMKSAGKEVINTRGTTNQIHVKFEAELHLLNDFNESLRQFMAVEKSLLDLQNKSSIHHETRDTQTSFLTKSTTEETAVSATARSSNVPTVASLNYSRGSDFHQERSSLSIQENSFANNETLITNNSELITDSNQLGNTALEISEINESTANDTRDDESLEMSQVVVNKDNTVYVGLSLGMFEQLIKDEDARIENLKTILKIREKALLDRTKGELAWLEIQKKQLLETGKLHEASLVKKKQRGILIKLQHEKHEMQKLKQMQKAASKERKIILKEQRNMIKTQLSMNSTVTKIKRTTSKERRASGPVKVYNYHRETVKSETRSSVAEEIIYESRSESIVSKVGRGADAGSVRSEEAEREGALVNTCTEIAKRSLLMREAALQKRRRAAEELLQWHQKLLEEERKITELEMAASNIINQVPTITIDNPSTTTTTTTTNRYKFLGSQLNVLWENMTGRAEKKFKDNESYNLSQMALERFCKDAKKYSNLEKTSKRIINKKPTLDLEKGIKQSESTLNEIMQNISNITDEISELYKLSSVKTDRSPDDDDDLQIASINASISEEAKKSRVPESSIESITTARSDRAVSSDDNFSSVKELGSVNSEYSSRNSSSPRVEELRSSSSVLSNEIKSYVISKDREKSTSAPSLNSANGESEISKILGKVLSECRNELGANDSDTSIKQSVSITENWNKLHEQSIQMSAEITEGDRPTESIQEIEDSKSAIISEDEEHITQFDEETVKLIRVDDAESKEDQITENKSSEEQRVSEQAVARGTSSNSLISNADRSSNIKDLSDDSLNTHISLEDRASSMLETSIKKSYSVSEFFTEPSEDVSRPLITHDEISEESPKISKRAPEVVYSQETPKSNNKSSEISEELSRPSKVIYSNSNNKSSEIIEESSKTTERAPEDIYSQKTPSSLNNKSSEISEETSKPSKVIYPQETPSNANNKSLRTHFSNGGPSVSNLNADLSNIQILEAHDIKKHPSRTGQIPSDDNNADGKAILSGIYQIAAVEEVVSLDQSEENVPSLISVEPKSAERNESRKHPIIEESLGKDAKNSHNTSVRRSVAASETHGEVETTDNEDSSKITDYLGEIDEEEIGPSINLEDKDAEDEEENSPSVAVILEDKDAENEKVFAKEKSVTSCEEDSAIRFGSREGDEVADSAIISESNGSLLHLTNYSYSEQVVLPKMNSNESAIDDSKKNSIKTTLESLGAESRHTTVDEEADVELIQSTEISRTEEDEESHVELKHSTENCDVNVLSRLKETVKMLGIDESEDNLNLSTSNEDESNLEFKSKACQEEIQVSGYTNEDEELKSSSQNSEDEKSDFNAEGRYIDSFYPKKVSKSDESTEENVFELELEIKSIETSQPNKSTSTELEINAIDTRELYKSTSTKKLSKSNDSAEENAFELELEIKAIDTREPNKSTSTDSNDNSKLLSVDVLIRSDNNETVEDKSSSSFDSETSEHSQMTSNDEPSAPIIEVTIEEKKLKPKKSDDDDEEDAEISRLSTSDSPKSHVNVKQRVSEILADANINVSIGEKSPRLENLYVTAYDVITPEGSPELGSPVENQTLTSKDIYGNEAEELLRKQLAIEQEIKQLEQQQQLPYLYMREIPNKPPPPYTPPVQTIPAIPPTVLPMTIEQIFAMTPDISKILFKAYKQNTLFSVSLPEDVNFDSVDKDCGEFVFDLCKEIASEHYAQFEEVSTVSWMKCNNRRLGFKRQLKQSGLKSFLDTQLKQIFGFEKVELKESMIIKWSRKKRDHVDELLVIESQAEEAEWTNYDQDELIVKNDVTRDLLHVLLRETAEVLEKIVAKRVLRNVF